MNKPIENSDLYSEAFKNCYTIARQFDELEQKLLEDYEECIQNSLQRRFTQPVLMFIIAIFALIGAGIAYIFKDLNLELSRAAYIGGAIGLIPVTFLIFWEVGGVWKNVKMRYKQIMRIIKEWKSGIRKLKRLSGNGAAVTNDYIMLTTSINKYIRSFKKRNAEWHKYASDEGKTPGERRFDRFQKNATNAAFVFGVGLAALTLGAALGGIGQGMNDLGSSSSSGGDKWINKATGEEFDYNPKI